MINYLIECAKLGPKHNISNGKPKCFTLKVSSFFFFWHAFCMMQVSKGFRFLQTLFYREWTIYKKNVFGFPYTVVSLIKLVQCCKSVAAQSLCFLSIMIEIEIFSKQGVQGWHSNSGPMYLQSQVTHAMFSLSVNWRPLKRGYRLQFRWP